MAEVNTHLREGLGEESRSFWQMAWVRFRRHPLARLGGWVLIFLYLGALFADFIAPYPEVKSFRKMQFAPPTPIHWRTDASLLAMTSLLPTPSDCLGALNPIPLMRSWLRSTRLAR